MNYDDLIHNLIDATKKMPLEKMSKERLAIAEAYPYYKNMLSYIPPEQVIYRIEPFNCFLGNVTTNQLYFKWPGKWEDIFDGAFVRTRVYFKQGNIRADQSYGRDYFCQCWSCEELENMWKLLSPPPYEKVMLISTVDKLMRGMWRDEFCRRYVGLVKYRPVENMIKEDFFQSEFKSSCYLFNENEVGMPKTFLIKPSRLSYEKEVRFIAWEPTDQDQQKERVHLMVDMLDKPCSYIDRILIDPRASEPFERRVREALQRYNLKVERSTKSKEAINNANVSEFYQSSKDNYGLPQKYSFSQ